MTTAATTPPPAADPPAHGHTPGTARAALAYPKFRLVFIGLALSQIGTWMQNFTLPAYIDSRTGRPALVGAMIFMQLGPMLLLSIPGGVLADRVNRRNAMLIAQVFATGCQPSVLELVDNVAMVRRQLDAGQAVIVYDNRANTCNIVPADSLTGSKQT